MCTIIYFRTGSSIEPISLFARNKNAKMYTRILLSGLTRVVYICRRLKSSVSQYEWTYFWFLFPETEVFSIWKMTLKGTVRLRRRQRLHALVRCILSFPTAVQPRHIFSQLRISLTLTHTLSYILTLPSLISLSSFRFYDSVHQRKIHLVNADVLFRLYFSSFTRYAIKQQ